MSQRESAASAPRRQWPFVSWSCALSPVVLLFVFIGFGIHVRLGLGHWPTPMVEDYHSAAFRVHEWVLIGSLWFALVIAGPLWLVSLFSRSLRPAWPRTVAFQLLLCAAGWLAIVAVLRFDPTTFSAWLLD